MIPKQTFPKQCLTRLLVWLWGSPPPFPRAPPGLRKRGGRIQQDSGLWERKEVTTPQATALSTALHPHVPATWGPTGKGRGSPSPLQQGAPSPLPKCIHTPSSHLGCQPGLQNQSPFKSGGPGLCPQPSALPAPGLHVGARPGSLRVRAQHRGDREEGETHLTLNFLSFFPSFLLQTF